MQSHESLIPFIWGRTARLCWIFKAWLKFKFDTAPVLIDEQRLQEIERNHAEELKQFDLELNPEHRAVAVVISSRYEWKRFPGAILKTESLVDRRDGQIAAEIYCCGGTWSAYDKIRYTHKTFDSRNAAQLYIHKQFGINA
jgi:hypothetical protein